MNMQDPGRAGASRKDKLFLSASDTGEGRKQCTGGKNDIEP